MLFSSFSEPGKQQGEHRQTKPGGPTQSSDRLGKPVSTTWIAYLNYVVVQGDLVLPWVAHQLCSTVRSVITVSKCTKTHTNPTVSNAVSLAEKKNLHNVPVLDYLLTGYKLFVFHTKRKVIILAPADLTQHILTGGPLLKTTHLKTEAKTF